MPSRLIRRRPLLERVKTILNPSDLLLWLFEEIDSSDWDQWQEEWAIPLGIALNLVFLVARANSGSTIRRGGDGIFEDEDRSTLWLTWFAAFTVHFLTLLSVMNAVYVFWRKRHYRLFENPIDTVPSTPSAQRVRVDTSSDFSSSPLRFLSSMLAGETPESRAHPDPKRDVWELAVWDPTPLSLRMFCFFSPGHVLVYWLFLPTAREDLRPSTTVATTIVLVSLLSAQLAILRKYFSQQSKDTSVIHKEVLNEYDTKYVHPRTRPMVRDVGIQLSTSKGLADRPANHVVVRDSVDTYTPTILVNKGFHTRPNPNYVRHVDPEGSSRLASPPRILVSNNTTGFETPAHLRNASSPIRHTPGMWQSNFVNRATGDGGNLGIYSHAHSPLRKATSMHFADMHRSEERSAGPAKREGSPLKRSSASGERVGQGREHGDSFLRA